MPTTRQTTFTEIIDAATRARLADTYHILPGKVVTYYDATNEADVQIMINDPRFDPETDELETEPWPVYPKVRVVWPRSGIWVFKTPLSAGDAVQVYFQDLDDSNYRQTGEQGDPAYTRRHGSDSPFCTPWDVRDPGPTGGVDALALASVVDLFIHTVMGWTPAAGDGGAALKTALTGAGFSPTTMSGGPGVQKVN